MRLRERLFGAVRFQGAYGLKCAEAPNNNSKYLRAAFRSWDGLTTGMTVSGFVVPGNYLPLDTFSFPFSPGRPGENCFARDRGLGGWIPWRCGPWARSALIE